MHQVLREDALFVHCPAGVKSLLGFLRCASTADGRRWVAKTTEWPVRGCRLFPIRLGVEFLYHALASHNGVQMPAARILRVREEICWAFEMISQRDALGKTDDPLDPRLVDAVQKQLSESAVDRDAFLRAAFIDVMLLNADRTHSNILHHRVGVQVRLFFIDHEQSLGWRADPNVPERNVIQDPDKEYARISSYTSLGRKYPWAGLASYRRDRQAVFSSLELDAALLDQARSTMPPNWITDTKYDEMKPRLAAWWDYLRARPYDELDQHIFG